MNALSAKSWLLVNMENHAFCWDKLNNFLNSALSRGDAKERQRKAEKHYQLNKKPGRPHKHRLAFSASKALPRKLAEKLFFMQKKRKAPAEPQTLDSK